MAITQEQLEQASLATNALQQHIMDLGSFIAYVQTLANAQWKFKVEYTDQSYAIGDKEQSALLDKYAAMKQQLVVDFNKLP